MEFTSTKEIWTMSEDDIRTKVVYEWLKDCGFNKSDISIEYSIRIQLGKEEIIKTKRSDILVKNSAGKNLFIIEVKKPSHKLHDDDKHQAISYARLLKDGIAPFSILTNGKQTLIYDSITGEEISKTTIPKSHSYIKNGYKISGDILKERSEALEFLITSSEENLIIFCKGQVKSRISILKSNDLDSGKKYIPELYIHRIKAEKDLRKKLLREKSTKITLILGKPQQGKTCFVCNTVETYLAKGFPCLFYPAITLKNGLLKELEDDFNWEYKEQLTSNQIISKLNLISEKNDRPLLIFIDGWNEMAKNAIELNDECKRLSTGRIKIILSTTLPSLNSLIIDEADNITYIGEETNLTRGYIDKFVNTQFKPSDIDDKSIVIIEGFNYREHKNAILAHEKAYNTKFQEDSNLPKDPFYIRLAAEQFKGRTVPKFTTLSKLIKESIKRKAARRGINEIITYSFLNKIIDKVLLYDTPLKCTDIPYNINDSLSLLHFQESAILLQINNNEVPEIDFYYTHDKDYCIIIVNQKLHELCLSYNPVGVKIVLKKLLQTNSGKSALLWFFTCPEYQLYIKKVFSEYDYSNNENRPILQLLVNILFTSSGLQEKLDISWLEKIIEHIFCREEEIEILQEEFLPIVYKYLQDLNKEVDNSKYNFWIKVLLKYDNGIEELGFQDSYIGMYYGDEDLRSFDGYFSHSQFDVTLFKELTLDNDPIISERAAKFLAYSVSHTYLEFVPQVIKHHLKIGNHHLSDLINGSCDLIIDEMQERYYGSLCRGLFDGIEIGDDIAKSEYEDQTRLWQPIIELVGANSTLAKDITKLLTELKYYAGLEDDNQQIIDPNQLKLDL